MPKSHIFHEIDYVHMGRISLVVKAIIPLVIDALANPDGCVSNDVRSVISALRIIVTD